MKLLLVLVPFLLAGCTTSDSGTSSHLGVEFLLRPGQQTSITGEDLTIKFKSVSNDSRCPADAACLSAGNAVINLDLSKIGNAPSPVQLNTEGSAGLPDSAEYLNYTIRITGLQPSPKVDATIAQSEYIAKFIVTSSTGTVVGGNYAQCDGHSPGTSDSSPEVTQAVSALVPSAATVNCTGKQSFEVEGRTVYLVIVPYGQKNDCPSGCFSSEVCAVVDGPNTLLYSGAWYGGSERPLSIPPDCPELGAAEYGDTIQGCTTNQPAGFSHAVTQTAAFQDFKQTQAGSGSFRFCFW